MKSPLLIATLALLCSLPSLAQRNGDTRSNSFQSPYYTAPSPSHQYHSGYTRSNGTEVEPYYSTKPDQTNRNNFSTQGNVNPYTGQAGTRAQDYSAEAYRYGQGRTVYEGPRGGQYYYNGNGNKVYVPKRSSGYVPY
jgi:hypothetical protein